VAEVVLQPSILEGKDNKVSEEGIGSGRFDTVFFHLIEIVWSIYSLLFEVTCDISCVHTSALWTNMFIFALRYATLSAIHHFPRESKEEIIRREFTRILPTSIARSISVIVSQGN
jgi:hypothetical protein